VFSALYISQAKARAFSAFEIFGRFGRSRLSSLRRARAFPALPPLYPRLGYSRSLSLQGTGVPGLASTARAFSAVSQYKSTGVPGSVSVFHTRDQHRCRNRASRPATIRTCGPIHASRAARRGPPANRLTPLPRPTPRLHVRVKPRTRSTIGTRRA